MADKPTWRPLVVFPDESPSFVHGFEAGIIWALMEAGQQVIDRAVHSENCKVLARMARYQGYECEFVATDISGWWWFVATKRCAEIRLDGRSKTIGRFATFEEARDARAEFERANGILA